MVAHPQVFSGPADGTVDRRVPLLRRRLWRWLGGAALGLVAIPMVTYLAAANVVLRTRLLRNVISGAPIAFGVSGGSTALRFDYDRAYSIFPGRVHLEGLTIRGRERTVEWRLTLDHADVAVALTDLFHRSFHATHLRSSGFTMRARLRIDRATARPEVLAALPPIAGLADPPFLDDGPEPPPLTDANYNLWMIDLEDVEVDHVRELWIHTVRSEGDTHVRGRWIFRPGRWLDVGPATVDANGVDVSYGSHPLATGIRGSLAGTVHPFDLREMKGPAIFEHLSTDGRLQGRAMVASALRLLEPHGVVGFKRWEAPFETHLIVDHGVLADGTSVRMDAEDCQIEAGGLAFQAPVRTEFRVQRELATMDAQVTGLRVARLGVEQARVASVAATLTSRQLHLAHVVDDARFTLDVDGAETSDPGAWGALLSSASPWMIRSGTVKGDGHADGSFTERSGHAALRIEARRLTVEHEKDAFVGDVSGDVHVDLHRGAWAEKRFDFTSASVTVNELSVSSARGGATLLGVPAMTAVAGRFVLAPSGAEGLVSVDLPRVDFGDLGAISGLVPLPAGIRIRGGTGRARLHAELELKSGALQGDGVMTGRAIRVGAGATEFFGDLDGVVTAKRAEGADGSIELSGSTLAIRHAGTGQGASSEDGWWGNAVLRETTLRTSAPARFDAKVHVTAKDASPATAIASRNMGVPGWAAAVFRMPDLEADAQVRVSPSSFEVLSLLARGGSTSIRAEYARRSGRQDGAVLMDLGWIGLGYDLSDGANGLVLVGAESWFGTKTAAMRGTAAAAEGKTDSARQVARYAAMAPGFRKDEARVLAAGCTSDVRSCDGSAIENLLRAATDPAEREILSGITYAPMVVAAAQRGSDGATLDPTIMGTLAEALRLGGKSTLDNIPTMAPGAAAADPDAARGRVVVVTGRFSSIRSEGPLLVGTLTTDAEPVYFATPFTGDRPETHATFRGVFVQRYAPSDRKGGSSLVLVGAFGG